MDTTKKKETENNLGVTRGEREGEGHARGVKLSGTDSIVTIKH